jgi:hypothetical protein
MVSGTAIGADGGTIDTGSGAVRIEFDRLGTGRLLIDTGSGSIDLGLPHRASADIRADTGSGHIRYELSDVEVYRRDDDALHLRVGEGEARVRLDTGSGGIRIAQGI